MRHARWVHAMFFLSGAASLTLQVVWFKQIQFLLGSSTFSVSVTVASFFLGLALGGALGGRVADRVARPLRAYGVMEIGLACMSPLVTWGLGTSATWVGWVGPWIGPESPWGRPVAVVVSLTVLTLPTLLMGATLPLLVRHLVTSRSQLAERVGVLYAVNTLGAAVGTFLVGFVWIGAFGVRGSAWIAAATYAAVGVSALALSRSVPDAAPAPAARALLAPVPATLITFVCGASGFVAIAYEVVWFRVLRQFSGQTVYGFSAMLGVYLLGLVGGSLIFARWVAPHKESLLRNYALTQAGIAVAAATSLGVLALGPGLRWLLDPVRLGVPDIVVRYGDTAIGVVGVAFCALIAPTLLIGVSFPLAAELVTRRVDSAGKQIGTLYAWNTFAGVLGSLIAGFVLLPMLGSHLSIVVLVLANLALYATLMIGHPALRADGAAWVSGGVLASAALVGLAIQGTDPLRRVLAPTGGRVAALVESIDATYLVAEHDDPTVGRFHQLIVNGVSYANSVSGGRRYMYLLADLPILVHRDPRSVLVICIGTGTTVGATTTFRSVDRVSAVDLSATVFRLAPLFSSNNERFFENPKVRKIVADGRHFLLGTDQRFDVLTFEPPPPSEAGVVNLYSEEFYALARQRMNPGGIVAQWIPINDVGREAVPRMILRAMVRRFAHVSLWMGNGRDGIAVASDEPLRIDPSRIAERIAEPPVARRLSLVGIDSVEDVLSTFIAADGDLAPFLKDAPTVTDDRPAIEYFNGYAAGWIPYGEPMGLRRPVEPFLAGPIDSVALRNAIEVTDAAGLVEDLRRRGEWDEANRVVAAAREVAPENRYLQFLERMEDYPRKRKDVHATRSPRPRPSPGGAATTR